MGRGTSCELCGLPVLGVPIREESHEFCCEGCKRVWTLASEVGIADVLDTSGDRAERARRSSERKARAAAAAGARRRSLSIGGMWCSSCALVLEDALLAVDGVLDVEVSYAAGLARVTWDSERTDFDTIEARVSSLGYSPGPARAETHRSDVDDVFLRFFVGAVVGMWVMWPTLFLLYPPYLRGAWTGFVEQRTQLFTAGLSLFVLLFSGWPFLVGAWRAARVGRASMDTLVVLGTWSAWLYSLVAALTGIGPTYFESASMITTIVLFGRWLEALGARDAIRAANLAVRDDAAEAWRSVLGDEAQRVPLASLCIGDEIAIRTGERVPVDGEVLSGTSEVDAARLTGESMPRSVGRGDQVFAGSVNLSGQLRVRVSAVGEQSLEGRFAALVEDAAFAKASAQRLADSVAGAFVPTVIAIAAATLAITLFMGLGISEAVSRMIAVLVVACPCALGLAVPMAVVNATAAGGRHGMAVRGGVALERAGAISTVAFDKTGTLTLGMPSVASWLSGSAHEARLEALGLAAALEQGDPHPAAAAIVSSAVASGVRLVRAEEVVREPGLGLSGVVEGRRVAVGSATMMARAGVDLPTADQDAAEMARQRGDVVVWIAVDGRLVDGAVLADPLRPEARDAVTRLRDMGLHAVVVSGDAEATSAAIARAAGIEDVRAEVLPHDKELAVGQLRSAGPVAFIGDGVNDAAALAAADLAVVTADASDIAVAVADVVLPPADARLAPLASVPALMRIAAASKRVIYENLGWAFTYNIVSIPLAVLGLLSPIAAAAAMALSSLAVVANSWRLRFAGGRRPATGSGYAEQRSSATVAVPGTASAKTSTTSG